MTTHHKAFANKQAAACHRMHQAIGEAITAANAHYNSLEPNLPASLMDRAASIMRHLGSAHSVATVQFPDPHVGTVIHDDGPPALIMVIGNISRLFIKGILVRSESTPLGIKQLESIRDQFNLTD